MASFSSSQTPSSQNSGNQTPDKQQLAHEIDARAEKLISVSEQLWERPELAFEECFAHDCLTSALEAEGIQVQRNACELETAFVAEAGSHGPTVAVICEYDALPGIGHACGHNIIAAAGLGAGLALASQAEKLGGKVRIIGTPAEEGGGGKVFMLQRGAFEGVDAAMMVHPADRELLTFSTLAVSQFSACYKGLAAHAAAAPERGRNALDAAVLGYMGVAALRQHIANPERIHGIFTKGGDRPNIVPATAETQWYVRSTNSAKREDLEQRVRACITAGAHSAGCEVEIEATAPPYDIMVDNPQLLALYAANAQSYRRLPVLPDNQGVAGSTDMGNVSQVVPSIHPVIKVAPEGTPIHSEDFTSHTKGESANAAILDGAKMLAATVADLWLDPAVLSEVKDGHRAAA